MGNYEILDDTLIYENLEMPTISIDSQKIAQRVLLLALCFAVFAGFCVLITMEACSKDLTYSSQIYFLIAALCTQFGTIFLSIRLFLYQYSIRKKQDWAMVFKTKYKVWRALATVLGMTLLSVTLLVLNANGFI